MLLPTISARDLPSDFLLLFLYKSCTADSGIPTMTGPQIEALIGEYNPALLTYMHKYYKNYDGADNLFWEHEVSSALLLSGLDYVAHVSCIFSTTSTALATLRFEQSVNCHMVT